MNIKKIIVGILFQWSFLLAQTHGSYYVVVKGDWLSKIAKKEYGNVASWQALLKWNPQIPNGNLIYYGEKIFLPEAKFLNSPKLETKNINVNQGDTYKRISARIYGLDKRWKALHQWNGYKELSPGSSITYRGAQFYINGVLAHKPQRRSVAQRQENIKKMEVESREEEIEEAPNSDEEEIAQEEEIEEETEVAEEDNIKEENTAHDMDSQRLAQEEARRQAEQRRREMQMARQQEEQRMHARQAEERRTQQVQARMRAENSKKIPAWIYVVIVLLILLTIGGVVFYFLRKRKTHLLDDTEDVRDFSSLPNVEDFHAKEASTLDQIPVAPEEVGEEETQDLDVESNNLSQAVEEASMALEENGEEEKGEDEEEETGIELEKDDIIDSFSTAEIIAPNTQGEKEEREEESLIEKLSPEFEIKAEEEIKIQDEDTDSGIEMPEDETIIEGTEEEQEEEIEVEHESGEEIGETNIENFSPQFEIVDKEPLGDESVELVQDDPLHEKDDKEEVSSIELEHEETSQVLKSVDGDGEEQDLNTDLQYADELNQIFDSEEEEKANTESQEEQEQIEAETDIKFDENYINEGEEQLSPEETAEVEEVIAGPNYNEDQAEGLEELDKNLMDLDNKVDEIEGSLLEEENILASEDQTEPLIGEEISNEEGQADDGAETIELDETKESLDEDESSSEEENINDKIAQAVFSGNVSGDYTKYTKEQAITQEQSIPSEEEPEEKFDSLAEEAENELVASLGDGEATVATQLPEHKVIGDVYKKSDLVDSIITQFSLTRNKAVEAVNAVFDIMSEGLKKEGDLRFRELFHMSVKKNKSYKGRNPKTGEEIKVPKKKVVHFKMGKELFELVNLKK